MQTSHSLVVRRIANPVSNGLEGSNPSVCVFKKVYINKKDAIAKFIYKIKPNKWKMNKDKIVKQLKSLNSSIEEVFKYKNKITLNKYELKLLENQEK